jgi:3-oxoacyl-[acyl-carrier protein] reductase
MNRRVAVVTGAGHGIGAAITRQLAASGMRLVAADIDGKATRSLLPALGSSDDHIAVDIDVSHERLVNAAFAQIATHFGHVDVLVNNAGVGGLRSSVADMTLADWHTTLAVNLTGTFLCTRAALPLMRSGRWGRIINIASIAGTEGDAFHAAYAAAKAGVIGFTKSVAREVAAEGILVNCVTPASIATGIRGEIDETALARLIAKSPLKRVGQPVEVAQLVAWLASDECSYTTGAVFDCSGGRATA